MIKIHFIFQAYAALDGNVARAHSISRSEFRRMISDCHILAEHFTQVRK